MIGMVPFYRKEPHPGLVYRTVMRLTLSDLVEILSRAGLTVRVGDDLGNLSLDVTRKRR